MERQRTFVGSFATMTVYDETFPLPAAFPPETMSRILAEVIADGGLAQFRTAETEKYAHVTYFFNSGVEVPFEGEERNLVDSQRVAGLRQTPLGRTADLRLRRQNLAQTSRVFPCETPGKGGVRAHGPSW